MWEADINDVITKLYDMVDTYSQQKTSDTLMFHWDKATQATKVLILW
jgi:hypothetical protein